MNLGIHYLLERSKTFEKEEIENNKKLKQFINKFIYFIGGFGIAVAIPQATKIWVSGDISGVSLITWAGFFISSSFWLVYGLVHKEKPIIYTNIAACFLQFLIILGIIIHKF